MCTREMGAHIWQHRRHLVGATRRVARWPEAYAIDALGLLFLLHHGACFCPLPVLVVLILRRVVARPAVVWPALGGVLPGIIRGPAELQCFDRTGRSQRHKGVEGFAQDGTLQLGLVRLTSGMAQWKVEKGCAWRIDRLRNIQGTGHA